MCEDEKSIALGISYAETVMGLFLDSFMGRLENAALTPDRTFHHPVLNEAFNDRRREIFEKVRTAVEEVCEHGQV